MINEQAKAIITKYIKLGCRFVVGKYVYAEDMKKDIVQYGDERAAAAIEETLYWRKIALELKAELATAREIPATAPGQNGR